MRRSTASLPDCIGTCACLAIRPEADTNPIRSDRNLPDLFTVMPRPILAMHAPQHGIASGLHRHVRMLGNPPRSRHQPDQVIAPIHGLDRTDPQFLKRRPVKDGANENFESPVVSRWF